MNKSENGFSIVEGLLILVITGLVGFIGWYAWHNKPNTKIQSNTQTAPNSQSTETPANNDGYVTIKEYGIKVSTSYADKLTYEVGCGNPYCSAALKFNQSVTTDESCNFVVEILQGYQSNNEAPKKIGEHYYGILDTSRIGSLDFSKCSSTINSLRDSIYKSITIDSISAS